MKLKFFERKHLAKGETNRIRREGGIPAVLYGLGVENRNIAISGEEWKAMLRNMKSGLLATTIFTLHDGKHEIRVIVKDIQYHVANYEVQHIDFAQIDEKRPVTINVPLQVLGIAECIGIKLGGFLRQVIRSLKVSCLPKDIPQEFAIDITDLNIAQAKKLSDIAVPANVKPLARMSEVAVVIAKR